MKRILITGANSYIGTSFEKYIVENYSNDFLVETLDMIDSSWRQYDFSKYDAVFHVAGIAHQKETKENAELYHKVNCELAIEVAKKAKTEGVRQFVFLSSMSVYGMETGIITKDTIPNPKTNYGKSKLKAEAEISKLESDDFKICILRPPMVYGKNCKGNFQSIIKIVRKLPIFPDLKNMRSMIYIENLCTFVGFCIYDELRGLYFPQNEEYVQTSEMACIISETINEKCRFSKVLGYVVKCIVPFFSTTRKAFGTLIYKDTEEFSYSYCNVDFVESVKKCMGGMQ